MTVLRVSYWEISMAQVQQGPSPIFTFLHTQFPLAKQFFFYNWATAQQKNTPESDKWLGANLALAYWAGQSRLPEVATKVATWMSFHCSAAAPVWEACRSEVRTSRWGIALNSRKNPPHPNISPSLQTLSNDGWFMWLVQQILRLDPLLDVVHPVRLGSARLEGGSLIHTIPASTHWLGTQLPFGTVDERLINYNYFLIN